jgi:hypothetical protein
LSPRAAIKAGAMVTNGGPGKLLSKEDADRVFGFTKPEWDAAAPTFIAPGWDIRFAKHDTGLHVIGSDPSSGFGFSLQPLFQNNTDPPRMVIIGNHFSKEQFPMITAKSKKDMESAAQNALGATYNVKATSTTVEKFDVIELMVTKA